MEPDIKPFSSSFASSWDASGYNDASSFDRLYHTSVREAIERAREERDEGH
jgi:hypothetical protein